MTLIAYHGSQEIKDKYVNRIQAHMDADELVQGLGFENGKGCFIGCTLDKYDHSAFPNEIGMPEWLAYLGDRLHEGCSSDLWPTLGRDILDSINPGQVIEPIRNKINIFILDRNIDRVNALNNISDELKDEVIAAINQCKKLHIDELNGVIIESAKSAARSAWSAESAARSARSAWSAESAARSAAWSARSAESAWSAARSAAWSARSAKSAAWSVRSAESAWSAESAAWSARSAAESAEYDAIASELLRLIKSTD